MYCRNCGSQIDEDSRFCSTCGVKIETERKSQNQIAERRKRRKRIRKTSIVILIGTGMIIGSVWMLRSMPFSEHPCDWCGKSPTKIYKIDEDINSYVCNKCSQECFYCGEKATGHAPNYFDMEVFFCEECYKEMN